MCNDFTAEQEEAALAAKGLNRREFAAIGTAALLAAGSTGAFAKGKAALKEATVSFKTDDGMADGFFVHPAKGKHPGVILWPDIAGLRDAYKEMARRLAGEGYAVLVLNHYYRSSPAPIMNSIAEWRTPDGQAKLKPMIAAITPEGTVKDAWACVNFLDAQKAVDRKRGIGTQGYCMGGPYTVRAAYAVPSRIKAAASFHGGGLVTDQPGSPHRLLAKTQASYLIAIARNDDARAPADKDAFRDAAKAAGRPAEVEVYNADHGWCTLDAPIYDKAEADRAWGRLLALYKGL
ncbi:dienelactone hydrolase family protein [Novosphingobium sp. B 225]|uniref:dienelactone hydrolase family protein n=1 Tax=Novosphingobium sp. B 225 TaxID=1961849 RepID=UPI000B4AA86A|nr:dienelactone hydrolase family protein [Novosphingobium sp. B 225]